MIADVILRNMLQKPRWRLRLLVCAVIGVYLTLAVTASMAKLPWSDEGGIGCPAYNLAFKGFMGTTTFEEAGAAWTGVNQRTYYILPLGMVIHAGFFKVLGFGIFSMRAASILAGLMFVAAWFAIVDALSGNRWLAFLAALIIITDYIVIMGASFGRYDMLCAAFGAAGWALYLRWRVRSLSKAMFAANLCVAASGLIHPLGVLYLLGLVFLVLSMDRKSLWNARVVGAAILPYIIGAAGWGAYILQSPADFIRQFTYGLQAGDRMSTFSSPFAAIRSELIDRYWRAFGMLGHTTGNTGPIELKVLILAAYVIGVAGSASIPVLRRSPLFRPIMGLTAIAFFGLMLLEGQRLSVYLVHIIPLYATLLALLLYWLWERRPIPVWIPAICLLGLVLLQLGGIALQIRHNAYGREYRPAMAFVRGQASDGMIMGGSQLGFGLGYERLLDDTTLGYRSHKIPEWIVVDDRYREDFEIIRKTDPDVYDHIMRTLRDYEKIYDHDGFELYKHTIRSKT